MITFDDFKKIDLRVARVEKAERVEGSEKLVRLEISLGDETRQIVAGIGKRYEPDNLSGKNIIIVANLEPKTLMGLESQGMLLAASNKEGESILLTTMEEVAVGSEIK